MKWPPRTSRLVGFLSDLREHTSSLLKGLTFLLAGIALIIAGTIVGYLDGKAAAFGAGTLAVTGVSVAFLGFFLHIVPPLLPAK